MQNVGAFNGSVRSSGRSGPAAAGVVRQDDPGGSKPRPSSGAMENGAFKLSVRSSGRSGPAAAGVVRHDVRCLRPAVFTREALPGRAPIGIRDSKISKISKILKNFANFWRALSRLYQNEILQENMRLTAFSSSTRCVHFCTAAISKFSQRIGLKNQQLL